MVVIQTHQDVLLAVEPLLVREALKESLKSRPELRIVGEAIDPIDILVAVRELRPDVIIQTWPDGQMPSICSHLFTENPFLHIVGISSDGTHAFTCQQTIITEALSWTTVQDMFDAIGQFGKGLASNHVSLIPRGEQDELRAPFPSGEVAAVVPRLWFRNHLS
jgi:hypothetical protein